MYVIYHHKYTFYIRTSYIIIISEAESFFVHFREQTCPQIFGGLVSEKVIMQRLVGDVANGYPPVVSMLDAFQSVCTLGFFRRPACLSEHDEPPEVCWSDFELETIQD